jgi:hypothetical protein
MYNGMTMTSPTAVLVIDALSAIVRYTSNRRSSWTRLGPEYTAATFSVHPASLSSVNNGGARLRVGSPLTSYSFNFADLNTVPYPTYSSAHCKGAFENCDRIWNPYEPKVGVPSEVTGVKTEWNYCTGWGSVRPMAVPITAGVTTTVTRTAGAILPKETNEEEEVFEK